MQQKNNPKVETERELIKPTPGVRFVYTNEPVWAENPDGTPRHETIAPKLMEAIHGDGWAEMLAGIATSLEEDAQLIFSQDASGYRLKDFETKVVLRTCRSDYITTEEALKMTEPTSEEEIQRLLPRMRLPKGFEDLVRQRTGKDPTPKQIEGTLRHYAALAALDKGFHQLAGLPEAVLEEIKKGRYDIFVLGPRSFDTRRFDPRTVLVEDLIGVAYLFDASKNNYWRLEEPRHPDGAECGLCPTAADKQNGIEARWVCYIERPTDQPGRIIAFPRDLIDKVLRTKHKLILKVFPSLLQEDMDPPCRWEPPRTRPRKTNRVRRSPYAPVLPREATGTDGAATHDAGEQSPPGKDSPADSDMADEDVPSPDEGEDESEDETDDGEQSSSD